MFTTERGKKGDFVFDAKEVGAHLRAARAYRKVTMKELAEAIGVSSTAVGNWESGECCMSFENAWKISDFFGKTIDELFGRVVPDAD